MATWCPARSIAAADRMATMVFPLPTSPWTRRCEGRSLSKSLRIWKRTFFWARVSSKGSLVRSCFTASASRGT